MKTGVECFYIFQKREALPLLLLQWAPCFSNSCLPSTERITPLLNNCDPPSFFQSYAHFQKGGGGPEYAHSLVYHALFLKFSSR